MALTKQDYEEKRSAAQRAYNRAVEDRAAYRRQEEECRAAKSVAINNVIAGTMKKINFERRIQDIAHVIKMIEDMDTKISSATHKAEETDQAYSKCIHCDSYNSASFKDTFPVKTVREDADIVSASEKLKAEKARLERELENLKREISANEQKINDLQRQINSCVGNAMACSSRIASSQCQIQYCKHQISLIGS